jgi:hypothetical protein
MLHFSGARLILGSGVLAALVLTGCSDDPVSVDPVATVTKTGSTDNLQADAGTVVARSPEVTLLRASGAKAVGETVTFTIEGGGGVLDGAVAVTDSRGTARPRTWTLGQVAAQNLVKATANGIEVTFSAIGVPGPAATVSISEGDEQIAKVSTQVTILPEVMVADQFGNGVQGETVEWQVLSGGGMVIGSGSGTSEPDGLSRVGGWQLGDFPGTNLLEATVAGLTTVQFTATAIP